MERRVSNISDDEIIAVVQAHKEGKQILFRHKSHQDFEYAWMSCDPNWNFEKCDYMVKPEPRKPREWILPSNTIDARGRPMTLERSQYFIRVREVIE